MNLAILEAVVKAYPERPVLDAHEWPYSRDGLERLVDDTMKMLNQFRDPAPLRYWPTMTGHVIRITNMKPLIHNGRTPR